MKNFNDPLANMMLDLDEGLTQQQEKQLSAQLFATKQTHFKTLSHTLLRSKKNPNEWYLFSELSFDQIGEGGFGTIYPMTSKIACSSNQDAKICAIYELTPPKLGKTSNEKQHEEPKLSEQEKKDLEEDKKRHVAHQDKVQNFYKQRSYVIKKQKWTEQNTPNRIAREAHRLAEQYVEVREVIHDYEKKESYIIMENCGVPLDEAIKKITDFESALKLALGIINAKKLLEDKGIVHRDIKPENICIRNGQVIFIDFGFAVQEESENDNLAGTLSYLAPGIIEGYGYSFDSDNYALAGILYSVFKAFDPLQDKDNLPSPSSNDNIELKAQRYKNICDTPFNDDRLFNGLDMTGVDQQLQQDIKDFLGLMQDTDPLNRPDWQWIYKFFASIPERQEALDNYQQNKKELSQSMTEMSETNHNLRGIQPSEERDLNDLSEQKDVLSTVRPLLTNKLPSHLSIVATLVEKNLPLSEYDQHLNAGIKIAINRVQALRAKLEQQLKQYNEMSKNIFDQINSTQNKFANRHSGFRELKEIARGEQPLWNKLVNAQKVGQSRVSKNLSNWWKQLHIPGLKTGRKKPVHAFYQDFAKISIKDIGQIKEYSMPEKQNCDSNVQAEMLRMSRCLTRVNGVLTSVQSHLEPSPLPVFHRRPYGQEMENEDSGNIVKSTMIVF